MIAMTTTMMMCRYVWSPLRIKCIVYPPSLQIVDANASPAPAAESSGPSTTGARLTMREVRQRQERIQHRFNKINAAITGLRKDLAEARRHSLEQSDRLLRIDIFMENILDNYLDSSTM